MIGGIVPVYIKKRNMIAQVFITIFTLGIYSIYWFYQISVELKAIANDEKANPALWTVLIFVPFASIYSIYKFSQLYEKVTNGQMNLWLLFVLYMVFPPAVWFIVQTELNRRADIQFKEQAKNISV
ncbi:MAG: hypothetical protein CO128_09080 [Ignavibacteriales bacterium CG_4_9_14_3_um_filter_30_11]|nr:MAG: hypothetical protein CO128_09080 [Ignavibacteriales bacterium CG_4_9_14_3_um_filter_30_11]